MRSCIKLYRYVYRTFVLFKDEIIFVYNKADIMYASLLFEFLLPLYKPLLHRRHVTSTSYAFCQWTFGNDGYFSAA